MSRHRLMLTTAAVAVTVLAAALPAGARPSHPDPVRVATFNASLNRFNAGDLISDLSVPGNAQADRIAEIIQRVRPDIVLINEFDFDAGGVAAQLFQDNYLSLPHGDADPIDYPYRFVAPSNTGVPSGFDLDNNGSVGGPGDAFGFGFFEGQFGMALFSRYPILEDHVRTFQTFRWADMPGALLPDDPSTPAPGDWYSPAELEVFRLSSKSHWDVPIDVGGAKPLHVLAAHPTPPVFDDPVIDQNGRRNHDEIRFWADYVRPSHSRYIVDDAGARGGLTPGHPFVIVGDYNADPFDGDSTNQAILQLLDHPRIDSTFVPTSAGAAEDAANDGGANLTHVGPPAADTADFGDGAPGNLRVDYVLPSPSLKVVDGGVFWPVASDPLAALTGDDQAGTLSSDHRLVFLDLRVPGRR